MILSERIKESNSEGYETGRGVDRENSGPCLRRLEAAAGVHDLGSPPRLDGHNLSQVNRECATYW